MATPTANLAGPLEAVAALTRSQTQTGHTPTPRESVTATDADAGAASRSDGVAGGASVPGAAAIRQRAQSNWNFLKSLHVAQKKQGRHLFKMGDKISLTTAEAVFLNMVSQSRLDSDHGSSNMIAVGGGADASEAEAPSKDDAIHNLAASGRTHFDHLVQAAVAKERLRKAISARLSDLSGDETKFLTKLVDNEEVTLEALENAVGVLNNDPLYNPSLRTKGEFIREFCIGPPEMENDIREEGEDKERGGKGNALASQIGDERSRRASGIADGAFDKALDGAAAMSESGGLHSDNPPRRRRGRRSSMPEMEIWNLFKGGAAMDETRDETRDDAGGAVASAAQSESRLIQPERRARKASTVEKSMRQLVHGESLDEANSVNSHGVQGLDGDDGLPVKAARPGDAIDPLLMAASEEKTPRMDRKTLEPPDESARTDLAREDPDEPLPSQGHAVPTSSHTNPPVSPVASVSQGSVAINESQDRTPPLLVCCGMETFIDDYLNEKPCETSYEDEKERAEDPKKEEEQTDIASKKRYLHLEENKEAAMKDRHIRLSTWMGSPEDYPILGLGRKKNPEGGESKEEGNGEEATSDPLEPHVLSPLLMKCLRDHLPYALKEENFWLKYSLVRDGASLVRIFDMMRHSQHTFLAIETAHGEVLGSFTSSPWRSNGNQYYGSCEAFVWMLRKCREEDCTSLDGYVLRESSLEVFRWNSRNGNRNVQLSNTKKLFVGGGEPETDEDGLMGPGGAHSGEEEDGVGAAKPQWGMALALDKDLIHGTSGLCATFGSIPLNAKRCNKGSEVFEIMNMEIWTLTPCMDEETAIDLELGRTFVMGLHTNQ